MMSMSTERGRGRPNPVFRHCAVLCVVGLVFAAGLPEPAVRAQDWNWQLGGVEAAGLTRVTRAQLVALTGLRAGEIVTPQDIEAARQRLLKSGLFTSVGFGYRTVGYLLIVTFTVQEVAWQTPVVFDNFVDHTDAQLIAGVARDVPTFDGLAPDQDVLLSRIAAALERLARESKDPGRVVHALIYDKAQGGNHWRFRLDRASGPLPICAIGVAGLPAAIADLARERTASLVGVDYSRDLVLNVAKETIVPLLGPGGAAQAKVGRIDVRREPARPGCERGVAVSITIDAGRPPLLGAAVQQ